MKIDDYINSINDDIRRYEMGKAIYRLDPERTRKLIEFRSLMSKGYRQPALFAWALKNPRGV